MRKIFRVTQKLILNFANGFDILVLSLSGLGTDQIKTESKISMYLLNTSEQIH